MLSHIIHFKCSYHVLKALPMHCITPTAPARAASNPSVEAVFSQPVNQPLRTIRSFQISERQIFSSVAEERAKVNRIPDPVSLYVVITVSVNMSAPCVYCLLLFF
ncbi:hypothetical protein V8C44DRAFT_71478 [Trichoderma aethiopicum]